MNIIDLIIIGIFVVYIVLGAYQGFVKSMFGTVSFFVALMGAWAFYGRLAVWVRGMGKIIPTLIYYSEGADMLGNIQLVRMPVEGLTSAQLTALLKDVRLPHPVDTLFQNNILGKVFAGQGLTTLGDYLTMTIVGVTVNLLCFVALFALIRILLSVAIHAWDAAKPFPVLSRFDWLAGGAMGILRCVLALSILFSVVPLVLSYMPVAQIQTLIDSSRWLSPYLNHNMVFHLIRGVIG